MHDALLLGVGIDVAVAGDYRVVGDVVAADGTKVGSAAASASLGTGAGAITVRAEGREIYNKGADGPFHLTNVVLTRNDAVFSLEDVADDIAGATAWLHGDFEHEGVSIDGASIREQTPLDADGDGLYDTIVVTATVNVDAAGVHQLNARLTTPAGDSIDEWSASPNLVVGANTVTMQFDTTPIGTGDYDTVFEVRNFVVYRPSDTEAFDYRSKALTTARYRSNQMEGFILNPPVDPRWGQLVTASTGAGTLTTQVTIEPQTTNESELQAHWDAPASSVNPPDSYAVDLAADEAFATVLATHTVPATELKTTFTAAEGLTPGRTYWFRARSVLTGGPSSINTTSPPVNITEEERGPTVVHAPVASAFHGQSIPIEMTATCKQGHPSAGRLFWRTTPIESELGDRVDAALGRGWHEVALTPTGAGVVDDRDAITWSGSIPGGAVTTAGVDYYLEAEDQFTITRVPGGTFVGTNPVPDMNPVDLGYWHVHTVTPPVIAHVPTAFAPSDRSVPLSIDVACSTGNCQATMYYRTTTGPITDEEVALRNGEMTATPNWPSVAMQQAPGTGLGQVGDVVRFNASIPASYVDTRGVDYFFHVTDGETQAWAPGTSYQGYYAPNDGMRTGWYHVHVLEQPHAVHVPPPTTGYRQPTPVSMTANCPALRTCTARLYYRTTTGDVLDTTTPFASTAMSVVVTPGIAGTNTAHTSGVIPPSVADTRGIDYFMSFTDGATTTYWPGTSHVDGYAPVAGTRVGYHHVRVIDPPHVHHTPIGAAPALADLVVETQVTCATQHCDVTLHYQKNVWAQADYPYAIAMTKVGAGTPTPVGSLATYRATIPAADVTPTQLAYYIEAFDGYTHGFAPGTSYVGAYVPTDGTHLMSFPVRVLEPAHVVHAPPGVAAAGSDLTITAASNCATPSCTATLHWRVAGALSWTDVAMVGVRTGVGVFNNDAMTYTAVVPGASVTAAGIEHWIEVGDGYVTERTPTWATMVV